MVLRHETAVSYEIVVSHETYRILRVNIFMAGKNYPFDL